MVKELINKESSMVRSFEAVVVLVISLMMICTNMGRASAAAAAAAADVVSINGGFMIINGGEDHWSNATTTGTAGRREEMEVDEFLMDSEANRRQLFGSSSGSINIYYSFPKGPICNAQRYGSCVGNVLNKEGNQCTLEVRCKH